MCGKFNNPASRSRINEDFWFHKPGIDHNGSLYILVLVFVFAMTDVLEYTHRLVNCTLTLPSNP